jgi:atypical dual specificity phosphatase
MKRVWPAPISKITDRLYLGGLESTDQRLLDRHGITHIINAAKELNYRTAIPKIDLGLDDTPQENLFRVLEPSRLLIIEILNMNPKNKILIHCAAGISRSASIVIYYIQCELRCAYEEALEFVRKKRPIVNPNIGFEKSLKSIEEIL